MHGKLILASLFAIVSLSGCATMSATPRSSLSVTAMQADTAYLSGDGLEGRALGTAGYDLAAAYVGDRFRSAGLKGWNGSVIQSVPLVKRVADQARTPFVELGGLRLISQGSTIHLEADSVVDGELVFVGHGLRDETLAIDDFKGVDLQGRVAVVIQAIPPGVPEALGYVREANIRSMGGRGIIYLRLTQRPAGSRKNPPDPAIPGVRIDGVARSAAIPVVTLDLPEAEALLNGSPVSIDKLRRTLASGQRLKPVELGQRATIQANLEERRFASPNIVAMIPGSDPSLRNRPVVVTAHLDHLGKSPEEGGKDRIFNGALDNAVGVSIMLDVARSIAGERRQPSRPIIFAAVTSEETMMLGSTYLVDALLKQGVIPAANVNIDMPVLTYEFSDITPYGADQSSLGPIVAQAASRFGAAISGQNQTGDPLWRSDQLAFINRGIPSVYVEPGPGNGGQAAWETYRAERYHKVGDDMSQPIDWRAVERFAGIHKALILAIANDKRAPSWNPGNGLEQYINKRLAERREMAR
ncbi:M20/M25/M40 family metallo-hydrolase [Sphingomonas colocasiae]|uniref:M28 family peptidase n=1 Tax=Sphingomonas colocasiae TaxID=1848973 RepID=A0ABS7PQ19_9SPHN|nr:M20/M25/M40 family metallo-hydrolase [Sphingomonas colocasiae]MBY8823341.1 M28 family peptidase [Sphingomonas colocasiae]